MYRFLYKGVVQGVGFRPTIYREAIRKGVNGHVRNLGDSVELIVDDRSFPYSIEYPVLARIDEIEERPSAGVSFFSKGFRIIESQEEDGNSEIPPDLFMCADCLAEITDKKDRRYHHFFNTCTNCGPRFSVSYDTPYDRRTTSMHDFVMCGACRKEYADPRDRRYHAQTIACHDCGPRIFLKKTGVEIAEGIDAIRSAASFIKDGHTVCIKGIGGYHICAVPDSAYRVRNLLRRADKPFAVMVKDQDMLEKIAEAGEVEIRVLKSPARPIVVLKRKALDAVSELGSIGVMFPYSALHYLLFEYLDMPLIMTSSNISGEPVDTEEGRGDIILEHDRKIVNRCDDSVVKVIGKPLLLRRSRGYVPRSITSGMALPKALALGAETGAALAVSEADRIMMSQHIGDVRGPGSYDFMESCALGLMKRRKLEYVCIDSHPGYSNRELGQKIARKQGLELVEVQHHKAHVASVALEHDLRSFAGIACDGLGYGDDGNMWGGEVFVFEDCSFYRTGSLEYQPMIGGDKASVNTKAMLAGILANAGLKDILHRYMDEEEGDLLMKQLKYGFNVVWTSSTGRVLDAAAAMLGICEKNTYEGRAAMLLESIATRPYDIRPAIRKQDGRQVLMTSHLFRSILEYKDKGRIAATVLDYIAKGLYSIAKKSGKKIVFSGGVAYNRNITTWMHSQGVLTNVEVPPGDGGLSFGQVAYLAYVHE